MRKITASWRIIFFDISECGTVHQLVCGSCGFTKDVPSSEIACALEAKEVLKQYESGDLLTSEYIGSMQKMDFPSFKTLQSEADFWLCPNCKEKVPATMFSCWKCAYDKPDVSEIDAEESDELPELPRDVTRSGNPWEN